MLSCRGSTQTVSDLFAIKVSLHKSTKVLFPLVLHPQAESKGKASKEEAPAESCRHVVTTQKSLSMPHFYIFLQQAGLYDYFRVFARSFGTAFFCSRPRWSKSQKKNQRRARLQQRRSTQTALCSGEVILRSDPHTGSRETSQGTQACHQGAHGQIGMYARCDVQSCPIYNPHLHFAHA